MPKTRIRVDNDIPFSADEVWQLAGAFNDLPVISSATTTSLLEDGGRIRVLTNIDGSKLWERLTFFNEEAKTLGYEIIDAKGFSGRVYGVGYRGRVQIVPVTSASCKFEYSAEFDPGENWTDQDAIKAIEQFAEDCVAGITRRLRLQNRSRN